MPSLDYNYFVFGLLLFLAMGGFLWILKTLGVMLIFWARWRIFGWMMACLVSGGSLAFVIEPIRNLLPW